MSASHRGLPLPAAMTLAQPPLPPGPPHPPAPSAPLHAQSAPTISSHSHGLGPLPPPPQWQPGSEESMRNWLMTKAEEERRRQEEEKSRQEGYRVEQRRIEREIFFASIERGVPPALIPLIFAGMSGGNLTREMQELIQQYIPPQQRHHLAQGLAAQAPVSPEHHRRDSQQYGYAASVGVPPAAGDGSNAQPGFVPYQGPGSPPRARAHTMNLGGPAPRPVGALRDSALPRLSTGEGVGGSHSTQQQAGSAQQDPSPSIYFHHWQPPASQSGSSQQASASVDSPKKRKATGPHQPAPPPTRRSRSPPSSGAQFVSTSSFSNAPPSTRRRGGHSRQRSDISVYTSAGRSRDIPGSYRGFSPGIGPALVGTSRETTFAEPSHQSRSSAHSVSSLLSDQPSPRFATDPRGQRQQQPESGQRSRATSEERERRPPPPPPLRERSHD